MTICVTPEQMQDALKNVRPERVAVAFVGAGWEEIIIDPSILKEVVLRPLLGSNPQAIEDLMTKLGDEKVHFLDRLHSKVFLGADSVFFGSANMSANGFFGGNFEVGMLSEEAAVVGQLSDLFDEYVREAKKAYPNRDSKIAQIRELKRQWRLARKNKMKMDGDTAEPRRIDDYTIGTDAIHAVWWREDFGINELAVKNEGIDVVQIRKNKNYLALEHHDKIRKGDWIMYWKASNGKPSNRAKFHWLRVDKVVQNGSKHDRYNKLVIQIGGAKEREFPFVINNEIQVIIRQALRNEKFPALVAEEKGWNLSAADREIVGFLSHIQNSAKNSANQ